jgi:hypothetical protein
MLQLALKAQFRLEMSEISMAEGEFDLSMRKYKTSVALLRVRASWPGPHSCAYEIGSATRHP